MPEEATRTIPWGEYLLTLTYLESSSTHWGTSRGVVTRIADGVVVADVSRNYRTFWHLFFQVGGEDWFVCGASYMGQTFCCLTTGERFDSLPKTDQGYCWASAKLVGGRYLIVEGCYWGAPYNYRVFDVSNPRAGWPRMSEEVVLWVSDKSIFGYSEEEGLFQYTENSYWLKATGQPERFFEEEHSRLLTKWREADTKGESPEEVERLQNEALTYSYPDREEFPEEWEARTENLKKFEVRDGDLRLVVDWKSEPFLREEREAAQRAAELRDRHRRWLQDSELLQEAEHLIPSREESVGFWYPSQVMRWKGETNPAYFRFVLPGNSKQRVYLEWGVDSGEVSLLVGSKKLESYPRTPEGFLAAFGKAQKMESGFSEEGLTVT